MSPILAAVLPMLSLNNGLGLTPAMGWNSWNPIRCEGLNQKAIFEIADAIVATGLRDVGCECKRYELELTQLSTPLPS